MNTQLKELKNALRKAKYHYKKGLRYYDKRHDTWNPASYSENILQHVSDLYGTFELLAFQPGDNNPTHPKYSYINTGDTYNLTLIYNHRTGKFIFSDIGTIIEKEQN